MCNASTSPQSNHMNTQLCVCVSDSIYFTCSFVLPSYLVNFWKFYFISVRVCISMIKCVISNVLVSVKRRNGSKALTEHSMPP